MVTGDSCGREPQMPFPGPSVARVSSRRRSDGSRDSIASTRHSSPAISVLYPCPIRSRPEKIDHAAASVDQCGERTNPRAAIIARGPNCRNPEGRLNRRASRVAFAAPFQDGSTARKSRASRPQPRWYPAIVRFPSSGSARDFNRLAEFSVEIAGRKSILAELLRHRIAKTSDEPDAHISPGSPGSRAARPRPAFACSYTQVDNIPEKPTAKFPGQSRIWSGVGGRSAMPLRSAYSLRIAICSMIGCSANGTRRTWILLLRSAAPAEVESQPDYPTRASHSRPAPG